MIQILLTLAPLGLLNLSTCRLKPSETDCTSQARWRLSTRPPHSLDDLHRPVHCCGVFVDKKRFVEAQLWRKTLKKEISWGYHMDSSRCTHVWHTLVLSARGYILCQQLRGASGGSWQREHQSFFLPALFLFASLVFLKSWHVSALIFHVYLPCPPLALTVLTSWFCLFFFYKY